MSEIIDFFCSIPNIIWSGVIASILTLSGVLISNRSNTKRLQIQLEHDAKEKAKERTGVLRRETYLLAVEELTKANSHLGSLPQKDPTKENLADGMQGFLRAAAKLQLVAEPKTALLVQKLAGSYGELTLRLMESVMPMHDVRIQINIHNDFYNKAQEQVSRLLSEMAKFNEAAQVNQDVFEALQRSFESYQKDASFHAEKRDQAWSKFNTLNAQFLRQVIEEMRAMGKQHIPVLVEIRRDLGLITELEAYKTQMEDQWRRMSTQLENMLQKMAAG